MSQSESADILPIIYHYGSVQYSNYLFKNASKQFVPACTVHMHVPVSKKAIVLLEVYGIEEHA